MGFGDAQASPGRWRSVPCQEGSAGSKRPNPKQPCLRRAKLVPAQAGKTGSSKQIRNPKAPNDRNAPNEANSAQSSRSRPVEMGKSEMRRMQLSKTRSPDGSGVWNFGFRFFGLVSGFDIRISSLPPGTFAPNEPNFGLFSPENEGQAEKQSQFGSVLTKQPGRKGQIRNPEDSHDPNAPNEPNSGPLGPENAGRRQKAKPSKANLARSILCGLLWA